MSTTSNITHRVGPAGPMAVVTNIIARGHWSVRHYGPQLGDLFLDALSGTLDRLHTLLRSNAAEAKEVEAGAAALVAEQDEAAADGVIDAHERRALNRRSAAFLKLTKAHQHHANDLAS